MARFKSSKSSLLSAAALSVAIFAGQEAAIAEPAAADGVASVRIEASSLGDALRSFSTQTGVPVIFSEKQVAGRFVEALSGQFSAEAALGRLLDGTGLQAERGSGGIWAVRQADPTRMEGEAGNDPHTTAAPEAVKPRRVLPEDTELRAEAVTVTGTSLRGIAPESSPLQIYSREDILGSGVTSTEQFMRALPQNFGGGSTEFAPSGLPGDSGSTFNNTFGSGANLRGLGSGATLTLLNGRRLAPTSRIGDFVDLSLIPISALDRIDVLTDGASSIYGGDAVAGVVNFILREDFDGAETAARFGSVTRGDMKEARISQTLGKSWESGNLLGTYEYTFRDNLTLEDRPEIPVPRLTGGEPIPDAGLFDLLPKQMRHSVLLSGHQDVGPALRLSATGVYSEKLVKSITVFASTTSSVLSFDARSEFLSLGAGAEWDLSPDWTLSFDANLSRIRNEDQSYTLASPLVDNGARQTRSDLSSGDLLLSGEVFSLPGGPVRAAVGGHIRREEFVNESLRSGIDRQDTRDVLAAFAELHVPFIGPGNARPGLERLELNLSGRLDEYSDFGDTANPKVGLLWSPAEGLNLRSSYSTSFSPPPLGRTGDLSRSATVLPFSLLRALLGGVASPDPSLDGVDYLQAGGTAADLDPETSESWTVGLDHEGQLGRHGWSLRSTWYDIDFEGRLSATPMPQNQLPAFAPFIAFSDPSALPPGTVLFFPDPEEIGAFVASLSQPPLFIGGASGLGNIGIINQAGIVRNLSSTQTSGIDIDLGYTFDADFGLLSAGLNVNRILDFRQQASVTTQPVETLSTLLNPVDLRLRGRLGLTLDDFSANLFVHHTDQYKTDTTPTATDIDAWTTVDVSMSYKFGDGRSSLLSGARISLSVTNLFDEPPPQTPSIGTVRIAGFDPTNASPLMRFMALEISKTF